jgi:hypothetical protein
MKRASAAKWVGLLVAIGLTGATSQCEFTQTIGNLETIASGSVSASQVYIATNIYVSIAGTISQYLALPLCPTSAPLCRTKATSQTLARDDLVAYNAVKALDAYVDANPGQAVPVSNYNVLVVALQGINALVQANQGAIAAATAK